MPIFLCRVGKTPGCACVYSGSVTAKALDAWGQFTSSKICIACIALAGRSARLEIGNIRVDDEQF